MNFRIWFLLFGAIAYPSTAYVQSAAPAVDNVLVTTSRIETPPVANPYLLEVLPEADLRIDTNIADALSNLANIYVQTPGGRSGIASIFLRGADPNFAAVLLDGVPLNNPTNTRGGSVNVSEIETDAFSRVEVVAGPLSSLYGSDALAGALNLIVPAGTAETTAHATFGIGSQEDYSAFARVRGPMSRDLGGSLALSVADDGQGVAGSMFTGKSITAKIAPLDSANAGALVFRTAQTHARAFPDSSGGDQYADLRLLERRDSKEALIGLMQPLVVRDDFRLQVSASAFTRHDETESPGVAASTLDPVGVPEGVDHTHYTRLIAQTMARFHLSKWQAVAGVEAQQESGRSEGELVFSGASIPSGFAKDRSTYSGFVEATRASMSWTFNAGARLDQVDDLGEHVTARAGMRYNMHNSRFSLRAGASTGFKAPSLYALGNPFVGNPSLDPETSRGWEAGIDWAGDRGNAFALTLFHTRFADLIDFVLGPPAHLDNRDVVISEGASASWTRSFSDHLLASVKVQYADTRDDQTDAALLNRPKWRTSATLRWEASAAVTISGRYSFVGERNDYAIPTAVVTLPGYHVLSLDTAWNIQPETTLRVVLDNALDDEHEDAIGFTSPGRRARLLWSREF